MHPPVVGHPALANLPQGWVNHGETLLAVLEEVRPVRCVELGTWRGASAIAMARVLRQWGGVLTCVDTWRGSVEGAGTIPGVPVMLAECAANVCAAGVASSVRFIPATTIAAGMAWGDGPIDFLYVDADHTEASVRADLEVWWPHVKVGGLVAGDDYRSAWYPGVTAAWDGWEREHGQAFVRTETPGTNPPQMYFIHGFKR